MDIQPWKLNEDVKFPVPRGTPMLSHLVHWDHSKTWRVPIANEFAQGILVYKP